MNRTGARLRTKPDDLGPTRLHLKDATSLREAQVKTKSMSSCLPGAPHGAFRRGQAACGEVAAEIGPPTAVSMTPTAHGWQSGHTRGRLPEYIPVLSF
jgi:hypothetical protein